MTGFTVRLLCTNALIIATILSPTRRYLLCAWDRVYNPVWMATTVNTSYLGVYKPAPSICPVVYWFAS